MSAERGSGGGAAGIRVRNTQFTRRRWPVSRHLETPRRRTGRRAGRGVGAAVRPRYPEGPACRVASPRASMRQCAEAPPVVIVIRRPETVKRAGVRSTRSARRRRLQPVPVTRSSTGALDVHDLVAEAGEQQADLVACEGVDPLLAIPDLLAPVVALAARRGRQGRGHDAHQLPQMALRLAAFAVQRVEKSRVRHGGDPGGVSRRGPVRAGHPLGRAVAAHGLGEDGQPVWSRPGGTAKRAGSPASRIRRARPLTVPGLGGVMLTNTTKVGTAMLPLRRVT